jgi:hypothetical protein
VSSFLLCEMVMVDTLNIMASKINNTKLFAWNKIFHAIKNPPKIDSRVLIQEKLQDFLGISIITDRGNLEMECGLC